MPTRFRVQRVVSELYMLEHACDVCDRQPMFLGHRPVAGCRPQTAGGREKTGVVLEEGVRVSGIIDTNTISTGPRETTTRSQAVRRAGISRTYIYHTIPYHTVYQGQTGEQASVAWVGRARERDGSE